MELQSARIVLESCPGYDVCTPMVHQMLSTWAPSITPGMRVLIKPNLINAAVPLSCTEGTMILAVAHWLKEHNARIAIGDSPAFGSTGPALARLGVLERLRHLGVEICSFRDLRAVKLSSGYRAGIAAQALDCDLLLNLPRLKAHAQTRVTCAVKNYFGTVVGLRKAWWHMVHGGPGSRFASLLVELLDVLPPSLTLVDGVKAMHISGPIHGRPYPLGVLALGTNPVAIDSAMLAVLGIDVQACPVAQAARRAGRPGAEAGDLVYPRQRPEAFSPHDFVVPDELNPIRFSLLRFTRSTVKRLILARQRVGH